MIRPDSYPNSTPPSGDFPYGNYKDETAPGANDGTGLFKDQTMDLLQPWFNLMDKHSIVPSNAAETAIVSQTIEALMAEIALSCGNVDSMNANGNYTVSCENKNGFLILEAPLNAVTIVAGAGCDDGNRLTVINRTGGAVTVTAAAAITITAGEKLILFYDSDLASWNLLISSALFGGTNRFLGTTEATSSTTGATQCAGGISSQKNIHAGGKLRANSAEDASGASMVGGIATLGGIRADKNISAGGTIKNADVTEAASKDTGAIVTEGGIGVEKSVFAGLTGTFNGGSKRGAAGTVLLEKIIPIGDWNMDSTVFVPIAHGLGASYKKIRAIDAIIRNDADDRYQSIYRIEDFGDPLLVNGGIASWTSINIELIRRTGGFFDTPDFDSTSYNRGWVYILYEA